ncbi:MAG: HAD-IIA family hydrolase [Methanoculleus sp.]|jgi:HAD superfamily hydrolase (TIGR01450 family)|nr:HAD-IIA family hydrolase [Methanomicrobiales archaeon]
MKAVILAAGLGTRLHPITLIKPKCLVKVGGKPIIEHQIAAYQSAGISDIVVISGYKISMVKEHCKNQFNGVNLTIIENKDFLTTNNMYSLYLAKDLLEGHDFILSNGDVVYDPQIVNLLVKDAKTDMIACDKGSYAEESMKISILNGYISDISKKIPAREAYGNSIDLYKFSSNSSNILFSEVSRIVEFEKNLNDWFEVALQRLFVKNRLNMRPFDIERRKWVEVDNFVDLSQGDKLFNNIYPLERKTVFIFDLDGTVYVGDKVILGVANLINRLRGKGKKIYFMSNNSSRSNQEYVSKLTSMGVHAERNEIIISTDGVIDFLKRENVVDVYVLGTQSMQQLFIDNGFDIQSNNPTYVVLGYDTELTYSKLKTASIFLQRGSKLIATHCDTVCPTPDGFVPDIGSFLALFERALGIKPVKIFGKPNVEMLSDIIQDQGINLDSIVIIGDRLYTDMKLARSVGCDFICVLSGDTRREDIEQTENFPDLILDDVSHLIDLIG